MGLFQMLFGRRRPVVEPNRPEPVFVPDPQANERRARPRRDAPEGTKILIIDDSPTIGAALRKILRSAGYVTLEALDAEHGLELMQEHKPGIVFLDIVLPGMNGFAALRAIRRDPATRDTPVIMMSGNEQATEQFFGTRIGADDFMKKPFSRFEVFARIERLLDEDLHPRRVISR
ncbi:response regulator [Viridibacterium curvum]|uniref:Response regulatory domain-containing protein n=1 Tax=Viridibacterium curvum TaxID=1101404 RepID=A0ABP9QF39_9RHOO